MIILRRALLRRAVLPSWARAMTTETNPQIENEVLFNTYGKRGVITLNRPKALNSLSLNMIKVLRERLERWNEEMEMIIIKGNDKAFCAGGDVVALTKDGPDSPCLGKTFFRQEYSLDYFISQLKVPYIALIHGVTMGGGVGLSVNGKYRIATERTLFAMPETAIGLFPDVGGSYFLPRLPSGLGLYLALTGYRLKGADVAKIGIATHYLESSDMNTLMEALVNGRIRAKHVDEDLLKYAKNLKSHQFSLACRMDTIARIFTLPTMEDILKKLEEDGSDWSLQTLKTLSTMSPLSMKITVKELEEGKHKNIHDCLKMEFRIASAIMDSKASCDFYEGVRALLIDKDKKPQWKPPTVELVTDEMVDKYFEELGPEELCLS